jgi:hypothetical protein
MSILLAAFAALGADVTPDAVDWADISGTDIASNSNQTISGIFSSISIGLTITGNDDLEIIEYRINSGSYVTYSAPFNVSNGDTLNFQVSTVLSSAAGSVTVTNQSAGGATLDSFAYNVASSFNP